VSETPVAHPEIYPQVTCHTRVPNFNSPKDRYVKQQELDVYETKLFTPALSEVERPFDTPLKYNRATTDFSVFSLNKVIDYIESKLTQAGFKEFEPLNFYESVNQLDRSTGVGYPHSRKFKSKADMLNDPVAYTRLSKCFHTCPIHGFYTSFPKGNEILKNGKRVRQICGCDISVALKGISVSHSFNKALECNPLLPIMVGISKYKGGWNAMSNKQKQCFMEMALDASDFDASVAASLLRAVCELRCRFAPAHAHERIRQLYEHLIRKFIVDLDGRIYATDGGMASGSISTAHDNSLISWMLFLCFIQHKYGTFDAADSFEQAFYGDDAWIGAKNKKFPIFTTSEIKEFYLAGNFFLKTECWVKPFQADFLSLKTSFEKGCYIPVTTRAQKMLSSMGWIERDHALDVPLVLAKLCSLRATLYGTTEFDIADKHVRKYMDRYAKEYASNRAWQRAVRLYETPGQIFSFIVGQQSTYFFSNDDFEFLLLVDSFKSLYSFLNGRWTLNIQPTKMSSEKKTNNKPKKQTRQTQKPKSAAPVKQQQSIPRPPRSKAVVRSAKRETMPGPPPQTRMNPVHEHLKVARGRPGHNKPKSRLRSAIDEAGSATAAVAVNYIKALFNPDESPPAPYPDSDPMPTVVTKSFARYPFTFITDSGNSKAVYGIAIQNRPKSQIAVTTASASGTLTWTAIQDDPLFSFLTSNAARYRVNALKAHVRSVGAELYEGGVIYTGNMITNSASSSSYSAPTSAATITGTSGMECSRLGNHHEVVWLPVDQSAHNFRNPADLGGVTTDDMGLNSAVIIYIDMGAASGTVATNFAGFLEVVCDYEYIPFPAMVAPLNPTVTVADVGKVAEIEGEALTKVTSNSSTTQTSSDDSNLLSKAFNWVVKEFPVVETIGNVASTLFDWVGGLFAATDNQHVAHSVHLAFTAELLTCRAAWMQLNRSEPGHTEAEWDQIAQKISAAYPSPLLARPVPVAKHFRQGIVPLLTEKDQSDVWLIALKRLRQYIDVPDDLVKRAGSIGWNDASPVVTTQFQHEEVKSQMSTWDPVAPLQEKRSRSSTPARRIP